MESAMTAVPVAPPFTYDDLRSFPDDGYRRELIDGQLIVSPSPIRLHQRCVGELYALLRQAAPPEMEVLPGPIDVVFAPGTVLVPDVIVVPMQQPPEPNITHPPLLVVEVASPSTRRTDRTLKLATYEAAGVPSYWLVDPEGPTLTVVELGEGVYGDPVTVTGDQAWTAARPFPVEVSPARLVRPGR
jgi:Uma2 family endonuclease